MTAGGVSLTLLAAVLTLSSPASSQTETRSVPFKALEGWREDDLSAALDTFRRGCPYRDRSLAAACGDAAGLAAADGEAARSFFERWFDPAEVAGHDAPGFLTGYYEPVVAGSRTQADAFPAPLLGFPEGAAPAAEERLPERASIEDGALAGRSRPLVWLDAVDAFAVHVQGSARIRLPDGGTVRVAYAGRNGWPYTAVARVLADRLGVPPAAMDANRLTAWLKANPDEGRALMRQNRSYIFFRMAPALAQEDGPIGAAGVPLTAGRSLAVDSSLWPYGLPVWLEGRPSEPENRFTPLRRLTVAQDTGSAIVGRARADLFIGSGFEAGRQAGSMRERVRTVVFMPRASRTGEEP